MSEAFWIGLFTFAGIIANMVKSYFDAKRIEKKVDANTKTVIATNQKVEENTQLTQEVKKEAVIVKHEARQALAHANEVNSKIESLSDRPVQILMEGSEDFEQILVRCLAYCRENKERAQLDKNRGETPMRRKKQENAE